MHWLRTFAVTGLVLFVCGCARDAATTTAKIDHPAPPQTGNRTFAGVVDKVNSVEQTVTIEHWPLQRTFKLTTGSEVSIPDKEVATLADLKLDDPVIVSYEAVGGVLVANRIERRSKEYIKEKAEQWERMDKMLNPNPNEPDSAR